MLSPGAAGDEANLHRNLGKLRSADPPPRCLASMSDAPACDISSRNCAILYSKHLRSVRYLCTSYSTSGDIRVKILLYTKYDFFVSLLELCHPINTVRQHPHQ